ncbi:MULTISPECIES: DUF4468 domain-containing protein [unclassified Prevotella]|uniref:DUF4468 domain-containing protein n=1 Tax=unclassified Prevotella TaxID=2638335 RepID=UPI000CEA05AE|nr:MULTISPECIES: DUF4468 domain-containing protein [unclassified Prevotella]MCX4293195.1 DUF4468 domain-containing protein [Prevotella sp.]NPD54194.1 DUF4468 domain-containing protein [Prevotella sp. PTAC]
MKKIYMLIISCLPLMAMAQNTWEMKDATGKTKPNPDQKYLAGAVPVADGKVIFEKTIDAKGKTAAQIYDIALKFMTELTKEDNQFEQSRITYKDSVTHEIGGFYQEWLVFKSTALVLDRTRLMYNLFVKCEDGKADIKMTRIYYLYDEEREPQTLRAEEWITDEYGLKKSKEKLSRVTGRFRRKTIDRKDYLFDRFEALLK